MSGSIIGNLHQSLRMQTDSKTLQDGRQWAFDIVAKHERGEWRGSPFTLKKAQAVVAERGAASSIQVGFISVSEAEELLRRERAEHAKREAGDAP